jgi:selenocysteine-specific translation elongation factor
MIVVATKIDAANPEKLKKLAAHAKRKKLEFHAVSAVTGEGIDELKWALAKIRSARFIRRGIHAGRYGARQAVRRQDGEGDGPTR